MSTTSERLQQLIRERKLKQADIIELCQPYCKMYRVKLGKSDISQFVSGKVKPGQSKLAVLSMALDVDEAWLMGFDVPRERKENTVPIVDENGAVVDPVDIQIAGVLLRLSPEEKKEVLRYMQYLVERR